MKKITILMILVLMANAGVFKQNLFKKFISKVPMTKISKTFSNISKSKTLKQLTKDLSKKALTQKEKLVAVASNIAKKSPFASKMMGSKDPLYAMTLYSKYGDSFFKKASILSKDITKINPKTLTNLKSKIPNFKFVKMDQEQFTNRFIDVMKATGKVGVKITKEIGEFALKHPKSAIAGILAGWYLSDPQGFLEQLDKAGGNVEILAEHIGKFLGNTIVGGASGMANGIVDSTLNYLNFKNILILISLLIIYLLFKFREIIIDYIKIKLSSNTPKQSTPKKQNRKKGGF